jgi:hypothetical protein
MIRYLKHHEIDKAKWDKCCSNAGNRFWFCKSWFLDLVSPNWHGIVSDNYETIMAVPVKRKFGINYIIQPFMMPQGGIVATSKLSPQDIHSFIQKIPSIYKYVNLFLNFSNIPFESKLIKNIRKNHYLKLNLPYSALRKNYSERVRVNMKTAIKSGNTVEEFGDLSVFIQFYKQYSTWLSPSQIDRHLKLVHTCFEKKTGRILLTQIGSNEITSGAFFFIEDKQVIVVLAFSSPRGKETCSMNLLYDKIISLYAEIDYEVDFTGSSMPGVAHFLEGFGAKSDSYPHICINNLPWYLKLFKK